MPTGFGHSHGRRSRANLSHPGGSEAKRTLLADHRESPPGTCWGCYYKKREPWEHAPGRCPAWFRRTPECSGS